MDTGLPGEGQVDYAYEVNPSGNNTPLLTSVAATSGGSPLWTSTLSTNPAGNITTDGASTYDYDLRNLLSDRQLPTATSQHTFTAGGRRVKTLRSDTGTTTELILGPGGQRLAKLETGVWRDYVYLGDRLIAYFDQGQPDPTLVFTNHIGMPLLATDGAGAPVWQAKAEPYGQLRGTINKIHDPGLRYPGQWQDELDLEATCTGDDCTLPGPLEQSFSLFENGYRWYRPDWGRYSQADPMGQQAVSAALRKILSVGQTRAGLQLGQSLYSYANRDPFRFTDPIGWFNIDSSCDRCISIPGVPHVTTFTTDLVEAGIKLAKAMVPCVARRDIRGCLGGSNGGEGITIKCGGAGCKGAQKGYSPGVGSRWFSICGPPFEYAAETGSADEIGITILHEWLHSSCRVPGSDVPGGGPDDAEGISVNAYRRLMRGSCGSR